MSRRADSATNEKSRLSREHQLTLDTLRQENARLKNEKERIKESFTELTESTDLLRRERDRLMREKDDLAATLSQRNDGDQRDYQLVHIGIEQLGKHPPDAS